MSSSIELTGSGHTSSQDAGASGSENYSGNNLNDYSEKFITEYEEIVKDNLAKSNLQGGTVVGNIIGYEQNEQYKIQTFSAGDTRLSSITVDHEGNVKLKHKNSEHTLNNKDEFARIVLLIYQQWYNANNNNNVTPDELISIVYPDNKGEKKEVNHTNIIGIIQHVCKIQGVSIFKKEDGELKIRYKQKDKEIETNFIDFCKTTLFDKVKKHYLRIEIGQHGSYEPTRGIDPTVAELEPERHKLQVEESTFDAHDNEQAFIIAASDGIVSPYEVLGPKLQENIKSFKENNASFIKSKIDEVNKIKENLLKKLVELEDQAENTTENYSRDDILFGIIETTVKNKNLKNKIESIFTFLVKELESLKESNEIDASVIATFILLSDIQLSTTQMLRKETTLNDIYFDDISVYVEEIKKGKIAHATICDGHNDYNKEIKENGYLLSKKTAQGITKLNKSIIEEIAKSNKSQPSKPNAPLAHFPNSAIHKGADTNTNELSNDGGDSLEKSEQEKNISSILKSILNTKMPEQKDQNLFITYEELLKKEDKKEFLSNQNEAIDNIIETAKNENRDFKLINKPQASANNITIYKYIHPDLHDKNKSERDYDTDYIITYYVGSDGQTTYSYGKNVKNAIIYTKATNTHGANATVISDNHYCKCGDLSNKSAKVDNIHDNQKIEIDLNQLITNQTEKKKPTANITKTASNDNKTKSDKMHEAEEEETALDPHQGLEDGEVLVASEGNFRIVYFKCESKYELKDFDGISKKKNKTLLRSIQIKGENGTWVNHNKYEVFFTNLDKKTPIDDIIKQLKERSLLWHEAGFEVIVEKTNDAIETIKNNPSDYSIIKETLRNLENIANIEIQKRTKELTNKNIKNQSFKYDEDTVYIMSSFISGSSNGFEVIFNGERYFVKEIDHRGKTLDKDEILKRRTLFKQQKTHKSPHVQNTINFMTHLSNKNIDVYNNGTRRNPNYSIDFDRYKEQFPHKTDNNELNDIFDIARVILVNKIINYTMPSTLQHASKSYMLVKTDSDNEGEVIRYYASKDVADDNFQLYYSDEPDEDGPGPRNWLQPEDKEDANITASNESDTTKDKSKVNQEPVFYKEAKKDNEKVYIKSMFSYAVFGFLSGNRDPNDGNFAFQTNKKTGESYIVALDPKASFAAPILDKIVRKPVYNINEFYTDITEDNIEKLVQRHKDEDGNKFYSTRAFNVQRRHGYVHRTFTAKFFENELNILELFDTLYRLHEIAKNNGDEFRNLIPEELDQEVKKQCHLLIDLIVSRTQQMMEQINNNPDLLNFHVNRVQLKGTNEEQYSEAGGSEYWLSYKQYQNYREKFEQNNDYDYENLPKLIAKKSQSHTPPENEIQHKNINNGDEIKTHYMQSTLNTIISFGTEGVNKAFGPSKSIGQISSVSSVRTENDPLAGLFL